MSEKKPVFHSPEPQGPSPTSPGGVGPIGTHDALGTEVRALAGELIKCAPFLIGQACRALEDILRAAKKAGEKPSRHSQA